MSPQVVGLLFLCIWTLVNGQPGNMYDGYYGRQLDIECYDVPTPNMCGRAGVKIRKYFFSMDTGKCTINYNSCGRSGFYSEVDCAKTCTCRLPLNQGKPCASSGPVQRYFFSRHSERCVPFTYKGCGGNGNNFPILAECQRLCRGQEVEREQVLRQLGIPEHSYPEYNNYQQPVRAPVPQPVQQPAPQPVAHVQTAQYATPHQQHAPTTWYNPPQPVTTPPPTYPPTPPHTYPPIVHHQQTVGWNRPAHHWNDYNYHYQPQPQPQQRQRLLRRRNFNTGMRKQNQNRRNNNNRQQRRRGNARQNRNRRRQRLNNQRRRRRRQRKNKPTEPPTEPPTTTSAPKKKRPIYTFSLTNFNAQPKVEAKPKSTSVGKKTASPAKKKLNNTPKENTLSGKSKDQNANAQGNKKSTVNAPLKKGRRRRPKPRTTEPPLYDPTTTTVAPYDAYYDSPTTTAGYNNQGFNGGGTTTVASGGFNNGATSGYNAGTTTVGSGTTDPYYY